MQEKADTVDIPTSFDSLSSVVRFIDAESKRDPPRLGLVSIILGELEEKDCVFPLTQFPSTYAQYNEFLEHEMKPCVQPDNKAATLKGMSTAAWHGKKMWKRKRKYEQKHAHLFHFVNMSKLNCLGFATVVVDACVQLGVANVFPITSEVHVWLGYLDSNEQVDSSTKLRIEELSGMAEIMTPDSEVGCPVREAMSYSWGYQRDYNAKWFATVWDYVSYLGVLIQNTVIDEDKKVDLITATLDSCKLAQNPGGLVELMRSYQENSNMKEAEDAGLKAVMASQLHLEDCNVYPYSELGNMYFDMGSEYFEKALHCFIHGVRVASEYKYCSFDSDLREDIDDITKKITATVFTPAVIKKNEKLMLALFVYYYDYLFYWFERSVALPPNLWQDSFKKSLAHFSSETLSAAIELPPLVRKAHTCSVIDVTKLGETKKRMRPSIGENPTVKRLKLDESGTISVTNTEQEATAEDEKEFETSFKCRSLLVGKVVEACRGKPDITIFQRRKIVNEIIDNCRGTIGCKRGGK